MLRVIGTLTGIVGEPGSSAHAGLLTRAIAPPAAIAEPMKSRRDKPSSSLAMYSPEKEHSNGGRQHYASVLEHLLRSLSRDGRSGHKQQAGQKRPGFRKSRAR